jgi:uroporphyrinogen-III synthase
MPLTRIVERSAGAEVTGRMPADAYIATSAAALRAMPANVDTSLPIHVVGKTTAEAARTRGFTRIMTGPGDGAGLAEHILADPASASQHYVYWAGETRTPTLELALKQRHVRLSIVEVYAAEPVIHAAADWHAALAGGPVAVLLYSPQAARLLDGQIGGLFSSDDLGQVSFLCLSAPIAGALRPRFAAQARIAARPEEDSLFRLLS